jgi:hypothetical protein
MNKKRATRGPPFPQLLLGTQNEPGTVQPAHRASGTLGFTAPMKSVASRKLIFAVDSVYAALISVQLSVAASTAAAACEARIASGAEAATTTVASPTVPATASLSADVNRPPLPSLAQSRIQLLNTSAVLTLAPAPTGFAKTAHAAVTHPVKVCR